MQPITKQKRNTYIDNMHAYLNPNNLDDIIKALNNYQPKIQFTYELEKESKISFLNVSITRINNKITKLTVFKKKKKQL